MRVQEPLAVIVAIALAGSAVAQSLSATHSSGATGASQTEIVFWQSIQSSNNPADFRAYVGQYPNGAFVSLAKNRIATLASGTQSSPPQSPPPSRLYEAATDLRSGASPSVPPNGEMAHVFVYPRTIWPGGWKLGGLPAVVAIDGGRGLKMINRQAVRFDLPAGRHRVTRWILAIWGKMLPITADIDLQPGQSIYLAADHYQNAGPAETAGGGFGLLGVLAGIEFDKENTAEGPKHPLHTFGDYLEVSDTGPHDITDLTLVLPASER